MSELATATGWFVSTLNGDATLQALPGYDATMGLVWDTVAAQGTTNPIFLIEPQGGSDKTTAMGGKRIKSLVYLLLKASGLAKDYTTLDTMADRADYLLSPWPDGPNHFPIQVSSGAWILSCVRVDPHQSTYDQGSKLWSELGGLYAVEVKIK